VPHEHLKIRQSLATFQERFLRLLFYPLVQMSGSAPWYNGAGGFKDYMIEDTLEMRVTNRHRGRARAAAAAHPKEALIVIVFYVVILLILVVLAGPTTGTSGIFGNTTVANNVRNAAATLATLTVVIGILAAVGIISDLV
jgi:preprotein translocase subunit SecG